MDKLMYDDEDVRAELMRIASGDPVGPFDGHRVVQRARTRRRQRFLSAGSAAAAVTAVLAVSATLLAHKENGGPDTREDGAAVATATASPRTSVSAKPTNSAMPAKPTKPTKKVTPLPDPRTQADPTADDATVLKACSASLEIIKSGGRGFPMPLPQPPGYKPAATDLTGWRMVTRSTLPSVGTVFIAISPDSELVAMCYVYKPGTRGEGGFRSTAGRIHPPFHLLSPYTFGCPESCGIGHITELGRVTTKVVRFRLEAQDGRTVDVPVRDGWYALIWSFHDPDASVDPKVTAYDADGRVVRPDPDFAAKFNREMEKSGR